MRVHDALSRLSGVKRSSNGWTAKCPAHDDARNSLSVTESKDGDGEAVFFCHAGCSYKAIASALGIQSQGSNGKGQRRIVATYDYCDESGTLLYQSVRYEPKGFSQRRPDGKGNWIWGLNAGEYAQHPDGDWRLVNHKTPSNYPKQKFARVRRVLYRWSELLEADPTTTVFIVEGEKDVDRLGALGVLATTNAGGAGKWRDEYNETLRGRPVVIPPDNDDPGRGHSETVARSLCGIANSIKIVPLPGLPDKGDVSDWLDAGGTVEQLYELVENTAAYACDSSNADAQDTPMLLRSFGEFMAAQFAAGEDIGFELKRREIGLLASVTNVGKSTLLRNAALALACGGEFAPVVARGAPRRVALLDFESSGSRLQGDLASMTRYWPDDERRLLAENFYILCEGMIGGGPLSLSEHLAVIEREAQLHQFDLIIVDTTSAAFNLSDENSNAEVTQRALKPLLTLARKLDCAIIMAHHIGKAKSEEGSAQEKVHKPRGASAFSGYAASVFILEADKSDSDAVTLYCSKRKSGPSYEVGMKLDHASRWLRATEPITHMPTSYELVVAAVRDAGKPIMRKEVDAALIGMMSKATITAHLSTAITRGDLSKDGHGMYTARANAEMLTPIGDQHFSISDVEDDNPLNEYDF